MAESSDCSNQLPSSCGKLQRTLPVEKSLEENRSVHNENTPAIVKESDNVSAEDPREKPSTSYAYVPENVEGLRLPTYLESMSTRCPEKKAFLCATCGMNFKFKSQYDVHLTIHTGEKSHTCPTCQKSFRLKGNLTKHTRTHTGEKTHKCQTCEKSFAKTNHLKAHIRTHTGEKPYICRTCKRAFADKSNLTRHILTHTNEI